MITVTHHPAGFSYHSSEAGKGKKGRKIEVRCRWSWELGYGVRRRQVSYGMGANMLCDMCNVIHVMGLCNANMKKGWKDLEVDLGEDVPSASKKRT